MKLYKIDKRVNIDYDIHKTRKLESMSIRWKNTKYEDVGDEWNQEFYLRGDNINNKLAEELFNDIEKYRTNKISDYQFTNKWDVEKSKTFGCLNCTYKDSNKTIEIRFNVILS